MRKLPRWLAAALAVTTLTGALELTAACGGTAAPTTAQCAVIVGDGQNGHDRNVHNIAYPGQAVNFDDSSEKVEYFACGPRNYKINDGSVLDANKKPVGDRFTPTQVWSKEAPNKPSILLNIWSSTYWTPNQGKLKQFYNLCAKYHCYSEDADVAAKANYSEPGWNGMLGENFGDTINKAAILTVTGKATSTDQINPAAVSTVSDVNFTSDIVRNVADWVKLGDAMSQDFTTRIRRVTGYPDDLFCGSGNSGWKNPNDPGKGEFNCTSVRIEIDRIEPADPEIRKVMAQNGLLDLQQDANAKKIAQAKQLYGDQWAYWLGVQDTVSKCQESKVTTCVVSIGGNNVTVPLSH